ncbi:MAG: DUF1266 domain-containing protein [Candidatus Shapirobacteria bacterium]|jgi:hypothetical protein
MSYTKAALIMTDNTGNKDYLSVIVFGLMMVLLVVLGGLIARKWGPYSKTLAEKVRVMMSTDNRPRGEPVLSKNVIGGKAGKALPAAEAMDINGLIEEAKVFEVGEEKTNYRRWAVALGGVLSIMNGWSGDILEIKGNRTAEVANLKEMLSRDWGVNNREELLEAMTWVATEGHSREARLYMELSRLYGDLSEDEIKSREPNIKEEDLRILRLVKQHKGSLDEKLVYAWDQGRLVLLVRSGNMVGYLSKKEAWIILDKNGEVAKKRFSSWEEFGENYALGREIWGGATKGNQARGLIKILLSTGGWWQVIPWGYSEK